MLVGDSQDRTFGLSLETEDGCTPCDCDPGASTSLDCPKDTGVCACRPHIGGRACDTPEAGYFVPYLDYLIFEAEFTVDAIAKVGVLLR